MATRAEKTDTKAVIKLSVSFAALAVFLYAIMAFVPGHRVLDFAVMSMGVVILASGLTAGRLATTVFAALSVAAAFVLFFPLGLVSFMMFAAAAAVYAVCFFFAEFMRMYSTGIKIREEELLKETEALDAIKTEKIEPAKKQAVELDKEIKDITSLYTAAKDLSASLRMEESIGVVSQIIKKMIKNFKVQVDDTAYVLIVKKEHEFVIADSHGYDEEIIKDNSKALVSFVLKSVPRTGELVYHGTLTGEENMATFSFIKSVVYMPFYIDKKLLGVLFLSGRRENLFTTSQVEKMKILSNYIAISLEKAYLYDEVEQMSIKDGLTGLYVHRYFQDKLENELKRATRYSTALSLVMCDIDFFKKINDTYGHLAGDFILKNLALILKNNTTPIDTVARYGGEEFIIIMPETDKEKAHARAVKIRKETEKYNFKFNDNYIKCTISMGVASYPADSTTRRALIEKADKALYKAKEEGRNRVVKA
jgi:diguanylate cyclase (GGDEF)-like protein